MVLAANSAQTRMARRDLSAIIASLRAEAAANDGTDNRQARASFEIDFVAVLIQQRYVMESSRRGAEMRSTAEIGGVWGQNRFAEEVRAGLMARVHNA